MRIPSDRTLESWIRELIRADKMYRFYKTDEWLQLRSEILADHHYECERCEKMGKLSRATMVHHEYEVKDRPDLALTRWIEDAEGNKREIMHPLCSRCHNDEHGRTLAGNKPKRPITDEKW